MVSYSPLKLTVEEEVPFTPPKSLQNTSMTSNGCEGSNETDCSSEDRAIQLDDHATISNKKARRTSCGNCSGCMRKDCSKCRSCRDMIKFGGPGIKKQKCLFRKCHSTLLPEERGRKRNRSNNVDSLQASPITSVKRRKISSHRLSTSSDSSDTSCVVVNSPSHINEPQAISIDSSHSSPTHMTTNPPTHTTTNLPTHTTTNLPTHTTTNLPTHTTTNPPTHTTTNPPTMQFKSPTQTCKSPHKRSPRKFTSPRKASPLKHKLSSVKMQSNIFVSRQNVVTPSIDHAPFSSLVHVNQQSYQTVASDSVSLRLIPVLPERQYEELSLGMVTMATSSSKCPSFMVPGQHTSFSHSAEGLELLKRYQTLKKQLISNPSHTGCHGNIQQDPPLHCSIYVIQKGDRFLVNKSRYQNNKRVKRQSLRLRQKEEEKCVGVTPPPDPIGFAPPTHPASSNFGQDLWSDHYQPRLANDIIGNRGSVSQLLNWLKQWKEICLGREPLIDRVSEDSFSSLQDEEDETAPSCPIAMVISGPTGVGKTAAVYACAQELGYKVLEINSTHLRTRQNILSTLREATLSHQMTIQGKVTHDIVNKPPPISDKPKGLFAFFSSKSSPVISKCLQKDKENRGNADGCGHTVALATTTLVLFEEVDLLFDEECRGFWSAVYDILLNSKRPLIFTTNETELILGCPYKSIIMAPPTQYELSLHCQLLSTSHDCHMTHEEANWITKRIGHDSRKLFNTLHFWLSGHTPHSRLHPFVGVVPDKSHDPLVCLIDKRENIPYYQLDQCVMYCDDIAAMDVLKSHDQSHDISCESGGSWWQCHVTDSLSDELCDRTVSCDCQLGCVVCMESLMEGESVLNGISLSFNTQHVEEVWCAQRFCCEGFHLRSVLSRQSIITEVLPILHLICKFEQVREAMKTSRRFTHYLSSHNQYHLKQFLSTGSFSSSLPCKHY